MKTLPKPFSFHCPAVVLALCLSSLASPLLISPRAAIAQTALVSNFDSGQYQGGYTIGPNGGDYQDAFGFTTGNTAYNLNSIQVYLASLNGGMASVTSLDLYNPSGSNANIPGTLAVSLGNQTVTRFLSNPTLSTFTPSSSFVLAANTRYIALLDYVSGSAGAFIQSANRTSPTARNGSGYSNFTYYQSPDDGASYPTNFTSDPGAIAIYGSSIATAAPEPSTLPLVGMGLSAGLGMVGVSKRRKVKKQVA